MAGKKRKKPKGRRKKVRGDEEVPRGSAPPSILALPVIAGPRDPSKATAYLDRFLAYEAWIEAGRPDEKLVASVRFFPEEYFRIIEQWPDGFEFYRNSLVMYLERVLGLSPWHSYVTSLVRRAEQEDPDGMAEFYARAEDAVKRYTAQSNSALRAVHAADDAETSENRLRFRLRAYCDIYEVDFVLWFIGVLAKSARRGRLDASWFGGPDSKTEQGALVSQVAEALGDSPFADAFASAYLPGLRNAVSHNDFEILTDPSGVPEAVRRLTSGEEWTVDQIEEALSSAHQMAHSVHAAAAHGSELWGARESGELKQMGIIDAIFTNAPGPQVTIYLLQLWCFYDLDPVGAWLDSGSASIEPDGEGEERLWFGTAGTSGPAVSEQLSEALALGWAEVVRVPVAPDLGLGHPRYAYGDRHIEIVGVPDRHVVPIHVTS